MLHSVQNSLWYRVSAQMCVTKDPFSLECSLNSYWVAVTIIRSKTEQWTRQTDLSSLLAEWRGIKVAVTNVEGRGAGELWDCAWQVGKGWMQNWYFNGSPLATYLSGCQKEVGRYLETVHPPDTKIQNLESSLDFYFIHLYVLPACMSVLHWHGWC